MSSNEFFGSFQIHTEVKLLLYQKYLERFLRILLYNKKVDTIYIYDLFCGAGESEHGQPGSALVGIKAAINAIYETKLKKKVIMFLNDNNKKNCDILHTKIDSIEMPDNLIVKINCDSFECATQNILSKHHSKSNEKVLFFLDPYGYKFTTPDKILGIKQLTNTEILLFTPVSHIYRFADMEEQGDALKKWTSSVPELKNAQSPQHAIDLITDCFKIENCYSGAFTLANQKSSNMYAVFFISSHVYGLEKFNEVKWCIDENEGYQIDREYSTPVIEGVADSFNLGRMDILHNSIKSLLEKTEGNQINNKELYEHIIGEGFLPTHFNKTYKERLYLDIEKIDKKARSGYTYLNHVYHRQPAKVLFKLRDNK
jgi:three-Cys-motif partner protein